MGIASQHHDAAPQRHDTALQHHGAASQRRDVTSQETMSERQSQVLINDAGAAARKKVMVVPFVPGIGERLCHIASCYQLDAWFSYPGKLSQLFAKHRGHQHPSKTQN